MHQSWLRVWFGLRALENCSHSLDMLWWSLMRLILWQVEKTAQLAKAEKEEIERKRSERAKRRKECQEAREKLEGEDWANPYESIHECQRGMNWVWYLHCMALRFPGQGGLEKHWRLRDLNIDLICNYLLAHRYGSMMDIGYNTFKVEWWSFSLKG